MTSLIATISPSLQSLVLRHKIVADISFTIQSFLQSQTRSHMIQLKAELHTLIMRVNDLPSYLNLVKYIYDQLEAAGCSHRRRCYDHPHHERIVDPIQWFHLLFSPQIQTDHLSFSSSLPKRDPNLALATTQRRPPPTTYRNPNYKGKNPRPYYPRSTPFRSAHKPNTHHRTSPVEFQFCKKLGHIASTCHFRYHPPPPHPTQ